MVGALLTAAKLAPAVFQAGKGLTQWIQGKKAEDELERPEMDIPESVLAATGKAESLASMRELPGQDIIENKMRGTTAAGASAIKDVSGGGDAMGALVDLFSNEQSGMADLGIAAEQNWLNNQRTLMNQLNTQGQYEQQAFDWNERAKYQEDAYEASALQSGAAQNIMGGLGSLGQMAFGEQTLDILRGGDGQGSDINDFVERIFSSNNVSTTQPKGLQTSIDTTMDIPMGLNRVGENIGTPTYNAPFMNYSNGQYTPNTPMTNPQGWFTPGISRFNPNFISGLGENLGITTPNIYDEFTSMNLND